MMSELRSKLSKFILIRNITVALFSIVLFVLAIMFIIPFVQDFVKDLDLGRKFAKYVKYVVVLSLAAVGYLVLHAFNRVINKNIMMEIFKNISSRIEPVSFSSFYKFKEDIAENSINDSSILYKNVDLANVMRTLVLNIDKSAELYMTEFKVVNANNPFAIISSGFKGTIAVFTDKNFNFNGKALFLDKSLYEKGKALSFYGEYDNSAPYSISNDVIKNNFYTYFSDSEMADKICRDKVIDAIVQIKTVYNKNLSISFADDKIYILIEKENIKLKTNEKDFENYMNKINLLVNLYDSLK